MSGWARAVAAVALRTPLFTAAEEALFESTCGRMYADPLCAEPTNSWLLDLRRCSLRARCQDRSARSRGERRACDEFREPPEGRLTTTEGRRYNYTMVGSLFETSREDAGNLRIQTAEMKTFPTEEPITFPVRYSSKHSEPHMKQILWQCAHKVEQPLFSFIWPCILW